MCCKGIARSRKVARRKGGAMICIAKVLTSDAMIGKGDAWIRLD